MFPTTLIYVSNNVLVDSSLNVPWHWFYRSLNSTGGTESFFRYLSWCFDDGGGERCRTCRSKISQRCLIGLKCLDCEGQSIWSHQLILIKTFSKSLCFTDGDIVIWRDTNLIRIAAVTMVGFTATILRVPIWASYISPLVLPENSSVLHSLQTCNVWAIDFSLFLCAGNSCGQRR